MARTTIELGKAGSVMITDTQTKLIKDLAKGKPLSPESWRKMAAHAGASAFTALRNKKLIKIATKKADTRLLAGSPTVRGNKWELTGLGKRVAKKL